MAASTRHNVSGHGPNFVVPGLWISTRGPGVLTEEERGQLAVISTVTRYAKGDLLYREGDRADAVFNLVGGVVKAFKSNAEGSHHIVGFLFQADLIGLASEGRYLNSAEAITPTIAYRIPTSALEAKLSKNAALEFSVICRLCHELRETQRHAFLLAQNRALARVGLFLEMIETHQAMREEDTDELYLPMTRSDIGDYIGISLEAVSRSFRTLVTRGIIAARNRHHVKILDRAALAAVITEG